MSRFSFVEAQESDLAEVLRIVNAHEASVDPAAPTMGESGVSDLMAGYVDESVGHLVFDGQQAANPEGSRPVGYVQLHPDANRELFFPDVYCDPAVSDLKELTRAAVQFMVDHASEVQPTWELRPGMNIKDALLIETYSDLGFEFLRKYWSLSRELAPGEPQPTLPEGVEIRLVEDSPEDLATLHGLHQDSFSNHFGFKPREREEWIRLEIERETREPAGNIFLLEAGKPVGFLLSANEMEHENGGYVDLLGVVHSAQGKGYGKLLLQWSIAYNSGLGRGKVDLNVDTGNTSAALHVYEKVGFKPVSAWQQFFLKRG